MKFGSTITFHIAGEATVFAKRLKEAKEEQNLQVTILSSEGVFRYQGSGQPNHCVYIKLTMQGDRIPTALYSDLRIGGHFRPLDDEARLASGDWPQQVTVTEKPLPTVDELLGTNSDTHRL